MVWVIGQIFWSVCTVTAVVAAVLAIRSGWVMLVGRWAVGLLMLVGGAVFNAIQLLSGNDYRGFADPALFGWVTSAWNAVVPAHPLIWIGLLTVFEATVGVLILSGRWTRLGYAAAIAFHLALWAFGWFEAVYSLVMLPVLVLLLRAEHRAALTPPSAPAQPQRPPAGVVR